MGILTGLDREGFAITPSVSYGVSIAARNVELQAGDNVIIMAEQFPSNVYAWRESTRRSGAELISIDRTASGDPTTPLLAAITGRTRVVAVGPCHWTDGTRVDLPAIRAALPEGALLVLDTAQSLGAMDLGLGALGADVVVGVTYKWLLGPYSVGFVWLGEELRAGRPIEFNWIARVDSENFAGVVDYKDEYRVGARRFDMGEVSNFALLPAAARAVELINEWQPDRIQEHAAGLTTRAAEGAAELGCSVVPEAYRSPHLTGLLLPAGAEPSEVADSLAARNVFVSVRGRSVRVSSHVFNTTDDVDALLAALGEIDLAATGL